MGHNKQFLSLDVMGVLEPVQIFHHTKYGNSVYLYNAEMGIIGEIFLENSAFSGSLSSAQQLQLG